MSEVDQEEFIKRLVYLLCDAALPFSFVQRESFGRFCEALRPGSSALLPGRSKMTAAVREEGAIALSYFEEIISNAAEEHHYIGIIVDSWQNQAKEHVEGVMLKVGNESFPVDAPVCGSEHDGMAVARGWEELLKSRKDLLSKQKVPEHMGIKYFLSDDAGQCARCQGSPYSCIASSAYCLAAVFRASSELDGQGIDDVAPIQGSDDNGICISECNQCLQ